MSFPAYTDRRGTDVDWIGDVPTHWEIVPLKYLVSTRGGGTPSKANHAYWDGGNVPWASSKDLKSESLDDTIDHITEFAIEDGAAELVDAGSPLVVVRGMILAHTFPVVSALVPMAINQDLKALIPQDRLYADFLCWTLRGSSGETLDRVDEAAHGTKVLRMDSWLATPFAVPPLDEQKAISLFLDVETSKIDGLVSEQRRLIELLKEKRQAVISHAVTKGLNPNAPLKPSGIVGFGNVPEHWELKKLGWLLRESPKNGTSPQINANGQTPTFSIAAVKNGTTDIRSHLKYADISFEDAQPYLVQKDDILVLRANGNIALVGTAGIVANEPPDNCIYPGILIRIRPFKQITSWYLVTVLNSDAMRPAVEMAAQTASGVWKISGKSLQDLRLAVPPADEQLDIERECRNKMETFNQLQAAAERAIELLQERRTALISAAVTGKIDVREFACQETA